MRWPFWWSLFLRTLRSQLQFFLLFPLWLPPFGPKFSHDIDSLDTSRRKPLSLGSCVVAGNIWLDNGRAWFFSRSRLAGWSPQPHLHDHGRLHLATPDYWWLRQPRVSPKDYLCDKGMNWLCASCAPRFHHPFCFLGRHQPHRWRGPCLLAGTRPNRKACSARWQHLLQEVRYQSRPWQHTPSRTPSRVSWRKGSYPYLVDRRRACSSPGHSAFFDWERHRRYLSASLRAAYRGWHLSVVLPQFASWHSSWQISCPR